MRFIIALLPFLLYMSKSHSSDLIAEKKRPFSVSDYASLSALSNLTVSPTGRFIAFEKTKPQGQGKPAIRNIWMIDLKNQSMEPKQVTFGESQDYSPSWSKDGRHLYYLSDRTNRAFPVQVWRINVFALETQNLTSVDFPILSYKLSPSENFLVLSTLLHRSCQTAKCSQKLDQKTQETDSTLEVNHANKYVPQQAPRLNPKTPRLFAIPIDDRSNIIDYQKYFSQNITLEPHLASPQLAFSADGNALYFAARKLNSLSSNFENYDVYSIPSDASSDPVNHSNQSRSLDMFPALSNNGMWLAYLSRSTFKNEPRKVDLILKNLTDGKVTNISKNWGDSVSRFAFTQDGRYMIVSALSGIDQLLFKINLKTGARSKLINRGFVSEFVITNSQIIYGLETFTKPKNYYAMPLGGGASKQITHINDELMEVVQLGYSQRFQFEGQQKKPAYGYTVKPSQTDDERKYPTVLLLHGDPASTWGNRFSGLISAQLFASLGYGVIILSPPDISSQTNQGTSKGYSNDSHLHRGFKMAQQRFSWIDSTKICALSSSYGGYIANWLAENWQQPFRCLINYAGDLSTLNSTDFNGDPWVLPLKQQNSHFSFTHGSLPETTKVFHESWDVPMLVLHGGPSSENPTAVSKKRTNFSLAVSGGRNRSVYFPTTGHAIKDPKHIAKWYKEVDHWLKKYLNLSN